MTGISDRRVAVIGAGGLGHPAALSLAEAGVRVLLVDDDRVELSNLQRQVLFGTGDVGRLKVEAARERLVAQVPRAVVDGIAARVAVETIDGLLRRGGGVVDGVIDATDDPKVRFVLNDWALAAGVPVVLGGIQRFQGMVLAVGGGFGPCFRCLFEELEGAPLTCAEGGVLGALAGVVGHLEAARMLAMLDGRAAEATGFVTTIDAQRARIRRVPLPERTACRACGGLEARLDITGERCPFTWVRTRLALEAARAGGLVEVLMREGEAARNVPRNARDEGHAVVCEGTVGEGRYRALIRKAA